MKLGWVTGEVEFVPLTMVLARLADRPRIELPPGIAIHAYEDGEEAIWTSIEHDAGSFPSEAAALAHFEAEFGAHQARLRERMLFIEDADGPFGTTTAWDGELAGKPSGRIHWVGIRPGYQGRGYSKPLLSAALDRFVPDYDSAYLTTETTSYRGISLYLGFGFRPWLETAEDRRGWQIVSDKLGKFLI